MFLRTTRRTLTSGSLRAVPTVRHSSSNTSGTLQSRTPENPLPANDPNPPSNPQSPTVRTTNRLPTSAGGAHDGSIVESAEDGERKRVMQAPNRATTWSRSQQPRARAMTGPRFEQTLMEDQPRPLAAIDLIHKQPVRWTKERVVSCDGGGGPLGHPRIFINVDKPKICWCTYCGVPFAHEHHRKHLESLPSTSYPLGPSGDAAALPGSHVTGKTGSSEAYQTSTGQPLEQR